MAKSATAARWAPNRTGSGLSQTALVALRPLQRMVAPPIRPDLCDIVDVYPRPSPSPKASFTRDQRAALAVSWLVRSSAAGSFVISDIASLSLPRLGQIGSVVSLLFARDSWTKRVECSSAHVQRELPSSSAPGYRSARTTSSSHLSCRGWSSAGGRKGKRWLKA